MGNLHHNNTCVWNSCGRQRKVVIFGVAVTVFVVAGWRDRAVCCHSVVGEGVGRPHWWWEGGGEGGGGVLRYEKNTGFPQRLENLEMKVGHGKVTEFCD